MRAEDLIMLTLEVAPLPTKALQLEAAIGTALRRLAQEHALVKVADAARVDAECPPSDPDATQALRQALGEWSINQIESATARDFSELAPMLVKSVRRTTSMARADSMDPVDSIAAMEQLILEGRVELFCRGLPA